MSSPANEVLATLRQINDAWVEGRADDLRKLFHPDIVMQYPGFTGAAEGADALLEGFEDFIKWARIISFDTFDWHAHAAGNTGVAGFVYEMVYERDGQSYRASGRDLWAFTHEGERWLAVWRTMLDVRESVQS